MAAVRNLALVRDFRRAAPTTRNNSRAMVHRVKRVRGRVGVMLALVMLRVVLLVIFNKHVHHQILLFVMENLVELRHVQHRNVRVNTATG